MVLCSQSIRKWKGPISALFIFCVLFVSVYGCSYYKTNRRSGTSISYEEFRKNINKGKLFILLSNEGEYEVTRIVQYDAETLTVELRHASYGSAAQALNVIKSSRNSRVKYGERILQNLVLIRADSFQRDLSASKIGEGAYDIKYEEINYLEIYDADVGKSIAAFVGISALTVGLLTLIVFLTKSSCPFLYIYDGSDYNLIAETFGGAIFPGLERTDYIVAESPKSEQGIVKLKIQNELLETQFINQVALLQVDKPSQGRIGVDSRGEIHSILTEIPPSQVRGNGIMLDRDVFVERDSNYYSFNQDFDLNTVEFDFEKNADAAQAKLVVNVRGSLWLDYVYGEFIELFGTAYNDFALKQSRKKPEEMGAWMYDQQIPLQVELWNGVEWEIIDQIQPIGPIAPFRELVVPINLEGHADPNLKIRLSTGFYFWDIDQIAVDYSKNEILEVINCPLERISVNGTDVESSSLTSIDDDYIIQDNVGDSLVLEYRTPAKTNRETALIISATGYYLHKRDFKETPRWIDLMSFRNPGRLGEFSRELYYGAQPELIASN